METQWFSSSSHAHWLYPSPPRSPSRPTSKDLGSPFVECSTTARWCLKEGPGASLVATTLGILHPAAAAPVGSGRGSPPPHVSPRWLALASFSSHKTHLFYIFPTARYESESPSDTSSTSQSELRVPNRSLRCPISENWECPLCLAECSSEFFPELLCCTHRSCLDCMQQYLRIEISESRVNINCPECSEPMHPNGECPIPN